MNTYNAFYKTVGGAEGTKCYYPTRLDTYGRGCFYNCKYCYSRQLLNFRRLWNPKNPGVVPFNKIAKVVRQIPTGSVVRLGGMTDCLQPIENIYKNTYNTIKLLNRRGIHYLIVTKSNLLIRPQYLSVLDKRLAHLQISIPTTDNHVLKKTDNAPSYEQRKQTVEELFDYGFDVSLRLSPFLYETVDFDEINSIRVDKCLVEFLRVKKGMYDDLSNFVTFKDYKLKEGGYRHLKLQKKMEILKKLEFKEISVCDDVQKHYNYFTALFNHNKSDCCNLRIL